MEIKTCPFCGSENIILDGDHYVCQNKYCERYIYEDTPQMEAIRHKLSALLMDTDEENPMPCDVTLEVGAQGLSEAEKAKCVSAFQDYDGIIWFNLKGQEEPIEFDEMCYDEIINDTNLEDVERILEYLLNK